MTKEQYFEMCEMLGTEPLENEIPIEYEDLPIEVQQALHLYSHLQDCWDYMGGNYIGKNLNNFRDILDIYEIEPCDRRYVYELIIQFDRLRAKAIQEKKPKK